MAMTVRKTGLDPYALAWHQARGSNVRIDGNCLEYDWIDGRPPRSYDEYVRELMGVWATPVPDHLREVLRPRCVDHDEYADRVRWHPVGHAAAKALRDEQLTPTDMVHGDPTFSNVIVSYGGGATLIDPGNHRGLCVAELDEAKVLQSYDGFEEVYRGITSSGMRSFRPTTIKHTRAHGLFQITHYVRLLKHVKCQESLRFAEQRIRELSRKFL